MWTLAITAPTLFLLTVEADNLKRAALFVAAFCAVLALLGVYIGWQASPIGAFPTDSLIAAFVLTMLVACFKGAMYLQQFAAREGIGYRALFTRSWRNFGVFGLSWALTAGVALVLTLWGALFAAIGIDFFQELFRKDWFLFPVLAVAFGLGVFIFRRLTRVIDAVTSLLEGLMRLLLPLAGLVVAIFLAALPFTGLTPLWETGNGTALLMALNAIVLFAVNAVYQADRHDPYPLPVHRPLFVLRRSPARGVRARRVRTLPARRPVRLDGGAMLGADAGAAASRLLHRLHVEHRAPARSLASRAWPGQCRDGLGRPRRDAAREHSPARLPLDLAGQPVRTRRSG